MTPLREQEMLQAKLAGLRDLLRDTPKKDPLAKAPLEHGIHKIETRLKELTEKPPINPQAEMFFVDGQVTNGHGLEITFASDMLKSYQNMVTNHYAAKNYGTLRRTGRRRGEAQTQLFLTALPRGSFGMQLSQPHVSDWVAATNVCTAMDDLSGLLAAAAESDSAFERLLVRFNPRVLKPLTSFMATLNAGGGAFRLVTGFNQVKLNREKIQEAYMRVSSATSVDKEITVYGTFGGITAFSWEFDFRPAQGEVIHGPLADEVTEDEVKQMSDNYLLKPAVAMLKETVVTTRSGKKKPTYELLKLKAATPTRRAVPPPEPDKP